MREAFYFKLNLSTIFILITFIASVAFVWISTNEKLNREMFSIKKFKIKLKHLISLGAMLFIILFSIILKAAGVEGYFKSYIEPFAVYWYAIMIVTGILLCVLLAHLLLLKKGYQKDYILGLALAVLPLALIGLRVYYIAFESRNWSEFFNFRDGGLAIYGGVIFGAIGIIICAIVTKKPILKTLDIVAAVILLGQAIGRWGNFFNQEAYGRLVTNPAGQWFPFAVFIDAKSSWYQATFFYEFFFNIIGFALIYWYAYKHNKVDGNILFGYFLWYGMTRVFVEGFRDDSLYIGSSSIRVSQVVSLLLIIAGIVGLVLLNVYKNNRFYKHFVELEKVEIKQDTDANGDINEKQDSNEKAN